MADAQFTTPPIINNDIAFSGGLNSTAGPFAVSNIEASDLQNIDFNKFGSILKRNGYTTLSSGAITNTPNSDGMYWFSFDSSGSTAHKLVNITDGLFLKMDTTSSGPDGTWDDETNGQTITADSFFDFAQWRNKLFCTNGENTPLVWDGGTSSLATATLPTNVTKPKYIKQFNNYLFYLNVYVSGSKEGSRLYWSEFNDDTTWPATSFIRISDNDGQEITGAIVLSDRLVVFKERSVYNVFFTGDAAIPFVVQKSNSSVGCIAPFSIQEVQNGVVFLSIDGFYFYDGNNSFKISDKITSTIEDYSFSNARSANQRSKNRYWCTLASSGGNNDKIAVWDYFNNSWSIYDGLSPSALALGYISGTTEGIYFADYGGFGYTADTGNNDNPAGVETAINAYFWTNWRPFGDLIAKKSNPHAVVYYQLSDATLSVNYAYDFDTSDQYEETIDTSTSGGQWDSAIWDSSSFANEGGGLKRLDLNGRGRVVRFKFANNAIDETFQIDGLGLSVMGETQS